MRRYNPDTHMKPDDEEGQWIHKSNVEAMEKLVLDMIEADNKFGAITTENGQWFEAYQRLKSLAKA